MIMKGHKDSTKTLPMKPLLIGQWSTFFAESKQAILPSLVSGNNKICAMHCVLAIPTVEVRKVSISSACMGRHVYPQSICPSLRIVKSNLLSAVNPCQQWILLKFPVQSQGADFKDPCDSICRGRCIRPGHQPCRDRRHSDRKSMTLTLEQLRTFGRWLSMKRVSA